MNRASWLGVVSLCVTLFSGQARAATVLWQGAAECRRELEVADQVETMTGRRLTEIDSANFELELEALEQARWRLSLTTVSRTGQRSTRVLEGPTCAEVTDAAAVAIALTIGNVEENRATAWSAPPASEPSARTPVVASPRDEPAPRKPAPKRNLVLHVGAAAALDSSATPELVPGATLRFGIASAGLRAELEGALYWPGQTLDEHDEGGSFQLAYLAPLLCGERRLGAPSVLLCGGYELGQLSAEGEGVSESRLRRTLWHGPRAELGLSWPLAKDWSFVARAGGVLALARHAFVLDAPQAVHRAGAFSLRAALGVELAL